jgi:hypothetical protein
VTCLADGREITEFTTTPTVTIQYVEPGRQTVATHQRLGTDPRDRGLLPAAGRSHATAEVSVCEHSADQRLAPELAYGSSTNGNLTAVRLVCKLMSQVATWSTAPG